MERKGAELSMNVIIIAAIALVVLIVLVIIFSGRLGQFGEGTDETTGQAKAKVCMANKGRCVNRADMNTIPGGCNIQPPQDLGITSPETYDWIDCTSNQVCCFSTG
ncbi:hypothetical protein JW968_05350 [Candidatus Woesearchaeota archaeon]|nr:hypothetical protein [Candidatus Woesearchaeota archaeon]